MQAYRGMDIGTAKPGAEELALLPHHLLDIRDPDEAYGVGDFLGLADEACARIADAGGLPVVAGGTGFYVRNFIFGLPGAPAASEEVRRQVAEDLEKLGIEALRAELARGDPAAAARIHPHDHYRIGRALEVLRQTGRPHSDFAPGKRPREGYHFLLVELGRPREELYARIDRRVDLMFESGLAEEVAGLLARGYGSAAPGMRAIGYAEFLELAGAGPGAVAEKIKQNSRRYAKRQETFFRGLPGLARIEISGEAGGIKGARALEALLRGFLATRALGG